VKVYGGQEVKAGGIIFRQTGSTVSAANGAMWLGQGQATAATAVFMAAAASRQPHVWLQVVAVHQASIEAVTMLGQQLAGIGSMHMACSSRQIGDAAASQSGHTLAMFTEGISSDCRHIHHEQKHAACDMYTTAHPSTAACRVQGWRGAAAANSYTLSPNATLHTSTAMTAPIPVVSLCLTEFDHV
jgi:hypothetical protein